MKPKHLKGASVFLCLFVENVDEAQEIIKGLNVFF
jgi:hypothetical protein